MSQGVKLSVTAGDSLLRFGHQVILVNKWTDSENFTGDQKESSCLLSTGIPNPASSYDNKQAIQMTASGTTMMRPTQRTALIIQKPNMSLNSDPVKYGDEIVISDSNGQLFLSCVKSNGRAARTCDVIFTNDKNRDSVWTVMHPSSHLRIEFDGTEVKANDKIVLAHSQTNKCLSVNNQHSNKSPYGREFEIMCELSTGNLSAYKSPILWTFTTQSSY